MRLALLPASIAVPLADVGFPTLTAIVRPLDAIELAQFHADFGDRYDAGPAMVELLRRQLLGIEGLSVEAAGSAGGETVPFDPTNHDHFRALPVSIAAHVWLALMNRTTLSEAQQGN